MTEDLLAALARGATLAASTPRLARSLSQQFGSAQLTAGRSAWPTPAILPWSAFVRQLWEARARDSQAPPLTPVQEQTLWESIVDESPEASSLIQPQAAARLAGEAWRLVQEWRIPLSGRKYSLAHWDATAETKTFFGWSQQFQFHTRWLDRVDSARLPESLLTSALAGPNELFLAGFDELTARQLELISALQKSGTEVTHVAAPPIGSPDASMAMLGALPDSAAEVAACAEWCRERLASNPQARIGVVVQDLEERRHRFDRAFRLAVPGAYHIALGPPLTARPIVAAALRLLEFGSGSVGWDAVSSLLLSPWTAGFAEERGRRASAEVALRRWRASELSAAGVARHGACPPVLSRALWQVDSLRGTWPERQKPGAWSRAFASVLDLFGWPGGEPLGSAEYQMLEAWRASLSELASTDVTLPEISRHRAVESLRRLAHEKRSEIENSGEPIQIMSVPESAGTRFDHLWMAGMNDEVWPARARPNPFVPLALQRQYNLPHSSPARELEFAGRVTRRLLQAADEVVVSYAKADAERDLAPSPFFSALPSWTTAMAAESPPVPSGVDFETISDAIGPAVPAGVVSTGGTRALEMQAKCPFRAFAELRLGARELDTPEPGLDPRERGGFLHAALEFFWKRFPSSVALRMAPEEEITVALGESVDYALARHKTGDDALAAKLIELERGRLIELVASWVDVEKHREVEFTVEEPEQERTVQIGGLTVQVRLDRLDKLATGAYALVDYKSRAPKLGDWDGERPESPQLPIYAVTAREPLAAIAFAQIRTGDSFYKGYSTLDGALPGAKTADPEELSERIGEWRRVLDALGGDFRTGRAEVDPKERFKTCEFCHLPSLCRVAEK